MLPTSNGKIPHETSQCLDMTSLVTRMDFGSDATWEAAQAAINEPAEHPIPPT